MWWEEEEKNAWSDVEAMWIEGNVSTKENWVVDLFCCAEWYSQWWCVQCEFLFVECVLQTLQGCVVYIIVREESSKQQGAIAEEKLLQTVQRGKQSINDASFVRIWFLTVAWGSKHNSWHDKHDLTCLDPESKVYKIEFILGKCLDWQRIQLGAFVDESERKRWF